MGYVAPVARAAGFKVGSTRWNADVVDNPTFLANPPACRLTNSSAQSLSDGSLIIITFNTETFDTDAMHSTTTNTGRITFNTAGLYMVTFDGEVAAATDYVTIEAQLLLNGTSAVVNWGGTKVNNASYPEKVGGTHLQKYAATDFVEARVLQDNTAPASRDLTGQKFSAVWVGLG